MTGIGFFIIMLRIQLLYADAVHLASKVRRRQNRSCRKTSPAVTEVTSLQSNNSFKVSSFLHQILWVHSPFNPNKLVVYERFTSPFPQKFSMFISDNPFAWTNSRRESKNKSKRENDKHQSKCSLSLLLSVVVMGFNILPKISLNYLWDHCQVINVTLKCYWNWCVNSFQSPQINTWHLRIWQCFWRNWWREWNPASWETGAVRLIVGYLINLKPVFR